MNLILSLIVLIIVVSIILKILDFVGMCCAVVASVIWRIGQIIWNILRFIFSALVFIYDVFIYFKTGGHKSHYNHQNQGSNSTQNKFGSYGSSQNSYQSYDGSTNSTNTTDKETLYLQVLELSRSELNQANLKRNYRRLAKKYHPDLHPGDLQKEEKFKLLTEAYDYFCAKL